MLNKEEKELLQYVLKESPYPDVEYLLPMEDQDPAVADRLVHLGLLAKRGWSPIHYQVTDAGRHYFRGEKEKGKAARKEWLGITLRDVCSFVLGGVAVELLRLVYVFFRGISG